MYHIVERNERRNRQSAFALAIVLHFALGAFIYFQAGTKPGSTTTATTQTVTKAAPVKSKPLVKP